jgi:hypothetical protein
VEGSVKKRIKSHPANWFDMSDLDKRSSFISEGFSTGPRSHRDPPIYLGSIETVYCKHLTLLKISGRARCCAPVSRRLNAPNAPDAPVSPVRMTAVPSRTRVRRSRLPTLERTRWSGTAGPSIPTTSLYLTKLSVQPGDPREKKK